MTIDNIITDYDEQRLAELAALAEDFDDIDDLEAVMAEMSLIIPAASFNIN